MVKKYHLIPVVSAIVCALAIGTVFSVYTDYRTTMKVRKALVRDMARVVDDHIHRTVKGADTAIGLTAKMIKRAGGVQFVKDAAHWEQLKDYAAGVDGGQSLWIFDADGNIVLTSDKFPSPPLNVVDRAYFQAAKRGKPLFVGPALRGKIKHVVFYSISKPVIGENGEFQGVILASMDAAWLSDFYAMITFDMDPLVGVYLLDGSIVARRPDMNKYIGKTIAGGPVFNQLKKASEGIYQSLSILDGKSRIAAFRTVNDYNLLVITGIENDRALAAWRARSYRHVAGTAVAASLIILAVVLLARTSRREIDAKVALTNAIATTEKMTVELIQARHDILTGLPSRALWAEMADAARAQQSEDAAMAIFVIDLDFFKRINDQYGHEQGDKVLQATADVLKRSVREKDIPGRLGGDEFVVCTTGPRETVGDRSIKIANRILKSMTENGYGVGCSIGISICPSQCKDLYCAVRRADEAMYEAKRDGKNRIVVWGTHKSNGAEWQTATDCSFGLGCSRNS